MKQPFLLYFFVVFAVFSATGCGNKSLDELSPKEATELYYQARDDGNIELLQQIIYFPPNISGAQRKTKLEVSCADEKAMMKMARAKIKVGYEKILNDDTAEVGVVVFMGIPGWKKRSPFQQIILKREDRIWKYSHSKYELSEDQLIAKIKENPCDASAIYHLGVKYKAENPAKAHRFFRKYYELEPDGFWVSKEFLHQLDKFENAEIFEKTMLAELPNTPVGNRATVYLTLGQFFVEHEKYNKAKGYLNKAEEGLKSHPFPIGELRVDKAKEELKLRLEGKYHDLLTELERGQEN